MQILFGSDTGTDSRCGRGFYLSTNEREEIDIRRPSFEEFVSFVCDREPQPRGGRYRSWYFDAEIMFDPRRVCQYYVRLFRSPNFLLEKYSKAQLEQGFWAIHGDAFDCCAQRIVWNTDLPFWERRERIESMSDLFNRLFATEPLEISVNMWWDSRCFDWECGNRDRARGGEDLAMQEVMFEVLSGILQSSSEICQDAALHGLGHLHHPATRELIENYIGQIKP